MSEMLVWESDAWESESNMKSEAIFDGNIMNYLRKFGERYRDTSKCVEYLEQFK